MLNGVFENPTKILFGKGMENDIGKEIVKYSNNILLHFGSGSIKRNGLYNRILKSLHDYDICFTELGGVQSNPKKDLIYEGIQICRNKNIDFILAIGGGSVIDSSKAIALGVHYNGDFCDFFEGKAEVKKTIKIGTILTIAGSGSESNSGAVISDLEKGTKLSYGNHLMFPVFSVMNPELTVTVPKHLTSAGIVDAISHILERYFSNTSHTECIDSMSESVIKNLMKCGLIIMEHPSDYDTRAEIMWASKIAHDNSLGFGKQQDWSCHTISHEIAAIYDFTHGSILAVIIPVWMKFVYQKNITKFVDLGKNVFGINTDIYEDSEKVGEIVIEKFKEYFKNIGMPTCLSDLGNFNKDDISVIAEKCSKTTLSATIGNYVRLTKDNVIAILEQSY